MTAKKNDKQHRFCLFAFFAFFAFVAFFAFFAFFAFSAFVAAAAGRLEYYLFFCRIIILKDFR
jgi:hypothetical protein